MTRVHLENGQPTVSDYGASVAVTAAIDSLVATLPDDLDAFRSRCCAIAAWDAVFSAARDQGVLAILMHYLPMANVEPPAAVVVAARRHCVVEQMWTSQVSASLEEALERLSSSGVKAAALKGPILAERFYPHPELRPCIDADLLVDETQLEAATTTLASLGYRREEGPAAEYARRHKHHVTFQRPGTPELELHFRLYAGFGVILDAADALSRASQFRTARGTAAWVLSPEDELLYLAVHAAGHSYVRLLWLYDMKLLLRASPGLDWGIVEERARRCRLLTVLAFTGQVLQARLGATVPVVAASAGPRWRLARGLLPTVMKPTERSARENFESLVFKSLLCDRPLTGLGLVGHHVTRSMKRRVQRLAPWIAPVRWSG